MREFALVFREAFSYVDSAQLADHDQNQKSNSKKKFYGVEVKWGMGREMRDLSDDAIRRTGEMYERLASDRDETFGWQILH